MSYVLFVFLLLSSAYASLEKIHIKNLDLDYVIPHGTGVMEKLSIGVSTFKAGTYPVEIFRRDKTFEITSQFVDFEWLNPLAFVHDLQKANTQKLSLDLDYKTASMTAESLIVTPKTDKEFTLNLVDFKCEGLSVHEDPLDRLKEDCLLSLKARASYLELPFEVMKSVGDELPDEETEAGLEMPASDFLLNVEKGDFYSHVRIKYLIRAYLKLWGHVQYENEGKTLAVRVDSIKFGVLPVTTLVMNTLRREINSPAVKIDPPWIRIDLGAK